MAGSMKERSPGVWRLRVFTGRDPRTGHPQQLHETFRGTEAAAKKRLAKLVTQVDEGKFDRTKATVSQLLDRWLANIEGERSPTTIRDYRGAIEHAIRPAIGAMKLAKLGPDNLDAWYQYWLAEEIRPAAGDAPAAFRTPTTVRKYHAIISAALQQALKWGWVGENVAKRASPPSARRQHLTIPTPEELQAMVRAGEAKEPSLGTAIALAALTGARRGELCALRWTDVALGRLTIGRSIIVTKGKIIEGPTKTHQVRVIALDALADGVLAARRQQVEDIARRAEAALQSDGFILSPRADGARPMLPDTLTHWFGDLMEDMEFPYHLHQLRHFSVTTALGAGVDVRTVAARHGHADARMTLQVYAHAIGASDQQAAEALGRALTPQEADVADLEEHFRSA
ncbi:MAG TPA: site-specific integrase [Acidimicrobiales bacterium]|nr:site-specific integrase [Acidimicrobiales bacterium]